MSEVIQSVEFIGQFVDECARDFADKVEHVTKRQFKEVLFQMIVSGDFSTHVTRDCPLVGASGLRTNCRVVYMPYARVQQLEAEVEALSQENDELRDEIRMLT